MHPAHREILNLILKHSGKPTQHTFLDGYLGNTHPRYPINAPAMRKIAKDWMKLHHDMSAKEFQQLLTSLIGGKSSTEKCMAGVLLDYSTLAQRSFDPAVFDTWLDNVEGWAEVDSLCTNQYSATEIQATTPWKNLLLRFSKSNNINKRRASLALFCQPLRQERNEPLLKLAFKNIDRLKQEKEILITKAISWVLRNGVKHHKEQVKKYVALNKDTLPKIALRETLTVLRTGKKTKTKIH